MKNCIFTCLLLMATSTANATLINIDFGPSSSTAYTGQGILGTASDTTWNAVDFGVATNLALADGSGPSGVGIDTTTGGFANSFSNLGNPTFPASNTLLADRINNFPTGPWAAASITLTGLTPGALYNVVSYNAFYAQEYSIGGDSAATDPNFSTPTSGDSVYSNWTQGVEYARLDSVMADASGNLIITATPWDGSNDITGASGPGGENGYAAIAGVQIQSVPLPAAVYLFGTGLLGLAGIARRKKTA